MAAIVGETLNDETFPICTMWDNRSALRDWLDLELCPRNAPTAQPSPEYLSCTPSQCSRPFNHFSFSLPSSRSKNRCRGPN